MGEYGFPVAAAKRGRQVLVHTSTRVTMAQMWCLYRAHAPAQQDVLGKRELNLRYITSCVREE